MPVPAHVRVLDAIPCDHNVVRLRSAAMARDMERLSREPAAVMWSEAPWQMPDRPRDLGTTDTGERVWGAYHKAQRGKMRWWLWAVVGASAVGVWLSWVLL